MAQAVRWQAQQLLDAEHDGHGADVVVVAVLLHPGIHDQGDDAVRHLDEERGKAEQDDGHKFLEVQPQVLPAEMQNRALAEEEGEDPDGTDGLAANRGERRAFASHIEAVDEYRIEDNVEGRPDEDGHHARLGKALAGNIVVQAQRELHSRGAEQVERKIVDRIPDGLFACPEHEQHRAHGPEAQHREHDRHGEEEHAGTAEDALGFCIVAAPHGDGGERRAAHAREEGEGRDDQDDGEGDAEPGQRQWANLRYPADENAVDNVVEEVDDLCKNARDGET